MTYIEDYRAVMEASADLRPRIERAAPKAVPELRPPWQRHRSIFVGMYLVPVTRRFVVAEIQGLTAAQFAVPVETMTARDQRYRSRYHTRPRQVSMYLCRRFTNAGTVSIGRRHGGRDHTTVIHAAAQITKLRALDDELDAKIRALEGQLS